MLVYADALFLLNAGADYALLLAAARLADLQARPGRLALGAALGGLDGVLAQVEPGGHWGSVPGLVGAALGMTLLTFGPRPWRVLLRAMAALGATGLLAGGLALVLFRNGAGPSLWGEALALGGTLLGVATLAERRLAARGTRWCELEIELAGRRAVCRALVDSGNRLRDPLGAGPVVVVDHAVLTNLVPAPVLRCLAADPLALPQALAEVSATVEEAGWAPRLRLLPYRSVGQPAGMLCGFRPDALRLKGAAEDLPLAVVGVSLPETVLLRRVLKPKLIALFIGIVTISIIITGYLFNLAL